MSGHGQSARLGCPDLLHSQPRPADQHGPRGVQHQPDPHPESLRFFAGHYRPAWHCRRLENPFDWGLPDLSFTHFGSLSDIAPSFNRNQTVSFGDCLVWNHGKHTWRGGGDFRRIELNNEADSNPRGSFIFTGENTAAFVNGQAVPNTGYDFADFLLGLPQQTSLETALNPLTTNSYHFRGNSWDAYAQDEWKLRRNLTLNLGVRWEYVSPFTEVNNRIANLILSPGVLNPLLGTPR